MTFVLACHLFHYVGFESKRLARLEAAVSLAQKEANSVSNDKSTELIDRAREMVASNLDDIQSTGQTLRGLSFCSLGLVVVQLWVVFRARSEKKDGVASNIGKTGSFDNHEAGPI